MGRSVEVGVENALRIRAGDLVKRLRGKLQILEVIHQPCIEVVPAEQEFVLELDEKLPAELPVSRNRGQRRTGGKIGK